MFLIQWKLHSIAHRADALACSNWRFTATIPLIASPAFPSIASPIASCFFQVLGLAATNQETFLSNGNASTFVQNAPLRESSQWCIGGILPPNDKDVIFLGIDVSAQVIVLKKSNISEFDLKLALVFSFPPQKLTKMLTPLPREGVFEELPRLMRAESIWFHRSPLLFLLRPLCPSRPASSGTA